MPRPYTSIITSSPPSPPRAGFARPSHEWLRWVGAARDDQARPARNATHSRFTRIIHMRSARSATTLEEQVDLASARASMERRRAEDRPRESTPIFAGRLPSAQTPPYAGERLYRLVDGQRDANMPIYGHCRARLPCRSFSQSPLR